MRKDHHWYHRPWHKLFIFLIAFFLWSATPPGLAQESKQAEGAAAEPARETEALNLGTEAYLYGYPLLIMNIVQRVMINVAAPEGNHAPLGQFAHHATVSGSHLPGRPQPQ